MLRYWRIQVITDKIYVYNNNGWDFKLTLSYLWYIHVYMIYLIQDSQV